MTPDGLEVNVDELAAITIKASAKRKVADMIADKVIAKYGDDFIKEVADSITLDEVRKRVIWQIADEIVDNWRRNG